MAADVPNDLSFLVGVRTWPLTGNGPRSLAIVGSQVLVARFSRLSTGSTSHRHPEARDDLAGAAPGDHGGPARGDALQRRVDLVSGLAELRDLPLERCAFDGLNWDLLNDGLGNPKNTRSLLWTHRTPPAMSTGVRETAETAVRAGLSHILFTVQGEDVAASLDTYLRSLEPLASPKLEGGRLSPAARRGEACSAAPKRAAGSATAAGC